ncbi:MAG: TIGR01459 family HAD-type hydrolase [Rhodospirillaceae bacterium]
MTLRAISGLRDVEGDFDGFILDLWGLVHDGERPYPPSADTLRALKAAGKKTLLLSNAPRRAHALVEAMTRMGLGRELYGEVLSSGEATREALIERTDPFFAALGRKAYHLGPERDRSVFEDTDLTIVADLAAADFIVNTGPISLDEKVDDYLAVLEPAAKRGLPMVCANPDFVVIRAGRPIVCAGAIAARYKQMGGDVALRGKPDPAIYALAVDKLGLADKSRVAVVGDALETDVKGARASGLASIWCTGGIHAEALGVRYGAPADPAKAEALARNEGQMPTYMIPGFIW